MSRTTEFDGTLILEVLAQDQPVVESQRPERIPTHLREELHLRVPDAVSFRYRQLLGQLAGRRPALHAVREALGER